MSRVAVIDYGMGNLHSVAKALEHAAAQSKQAVTVQVSAEESQILSADRVVLPGVGAMRDCMGELTRLGLDQVVRQVVQAGTPLLGVCVGMQVMMDWSDENEGVKCLGLFAGKVRHFAQPLEKVAGAQQLKIPHMGWNQVHINRDHAMWSGIPQDSRFYFVHSYYVESVQADEIAASCSYGFPFTVALARDNIFAVQFHPEKSQHAGLKLYENFLQWDGRP